MVKMLSKVVFWQSYVDTWLVKSILMGETLKPKIRFFDLDRLRLVASANSPTVVELIGEL